MNRAQRRPCRRTSRAARAEETFARQSLHKSSPAQIRQQRLVTFGETFEIDRPSEISPPSFVRVSPSCRPGSALPASRYIEPPLIESRQTRYLWLWPPKGVTPGGSQSTIDGPAFRLQETPRLQKGRISPGLARSSPGVVDHRRWGITVEPEVQQNFAWSPSRAPMPS